MDKSTIHAGHRKRLRDKYIENKSSLTDHELLELLLSFAIPRVNTNETAHLLIKNFGSFDSVLSADAKLLKSVGGVGENTAVFLSLVGDIINKKSNENKTRANTIEKVTLELEKLFASCNKEIAYIIYLDDKDKVIAYMKSNEGSNTSTDIDASVFTKNMLIHKPKSIILAHNHFADHPLPSKQDDDTTAKIFMLSQIYKVNFYDHLIFGKKSTYSYFYTNRLQAVKDNVKNKLNI